MSEIREKVQEMVTSFTCCAELKEAGQAWLDATEKLLVEIDEDIIPIDGLIAFSGSEAGVKLFGAEKAAQINAHGKEIKAEGALYCDCPACASALAVRELLK